MYEGFSDVFDELSLNIGSVRGQESRCKLIADTYNLLASQVINAIFISTLNVVTSVDMKVKLEIRLRIN